MNDPKNSSYICRLCLKFNRKTISLYNNRSLESLRMNKFIQQVCSIKLQQEEPFPRCICYPCRAKVISTQEFINTCKESDKTLRKIYYTSNDKDIDEQRLPRVKRKLEEEESDECETNIENENCVITGTRSLRSSKKVALIASLPFTAASTNDTEKPEDNLDVETNETEKIIEENRINNEVKENFKEPKIKKIVASSTQTSKIDLCVIKTEPDYVEEFQPHISEVILEAVKKPLAESETSLQPSTEQITIKEEFIIPDSEGENCEEQHFDKSQTISNDSNDSHSLENIINIEIKQEPVVKIKEEKTNFEAKKESKLEPEKVVTTKLNVEKEDPMKKDNIYQLIINEREEELFKRKLQYEKISNPKIMYRKSNADLEPGLFHKITSCPICKRVYDRKGNLYNHLKLQHNLLSMKEVHKVLSTRKELFVKEQVSCNVCNKDFDSRSTFYDHQTEHPGHMMQVFCENCNASFTSLNSKRRHQQLSCNKPYECLFCSTKFRIFKDFRLHMNTHKN